MAAPTAPFLPFLPPPPVHHLPNQFPPGQNSPIPTAQWTCPPPGLPFPLPVGLPNYNGFMAPGTPYQYYHHQGPPSGRGRPPFHQRKGSQRGRGRTDLTNGGNRPAAEFECRRCNKEYRTEDNYKLHLQSHEKCNSCDFEAVPRVLREHELVHLLPDELKFSTPEEIKKWREERRKNFPTAANIARKAELAAEKKSRGEVAKTPLHRYIDHLLGGGNERRPQKGDRRRGGRGRMGRGRGGPYNYQRPPRGNRRGSHRGRGERSNRPDWNRAEEGPTTGLTTVLSDLSPQPTAAITTCTNSSLPLQLPTSSKENSTCITGDNGSPSEQKDTTTTTGDDILGAILADVSTTAAMVGQTGGDDDDTTQTLSSSTAQENEGDCEVTQDVAETAAAVAGSSESVRECEEGSSSGFERRRGGSGKQRRRKQPWVSRRENKRRKVNKTVTVPARKPTLLEKLLAPEVRREQNAILQCIHYIVEQDFFDTHAPTTTAALNSQSC